MPRSSIIDSEFRGLLGCWSLISSQGDSHLWPFDRQQAHCPSILEQLDAGFSTHFTASEHSLLIYWSMSACGGHSQPPTWIFFPPFFSPFYQGMLAVQGAAGIRACKSTIYQLWMCPAPVSQSSLLVFLSFSHLKKKKKLCPTLWNTHPSLICILSWVPPFLYLTWIGS